MKRKLLGLLCACFLLSGCQNGSSTPAQTPATEIPPAGSHLPLLEQGREPEENSTLLCIPNTAVESMTSPEVRLLGNGLLLSEYRDHALHLKHISLEDGTLMAEGTVSASPGTKLVIGSGEIGLCDRESGLVSVLDESFRLLRTYPVPSGGTDWYLNTELDTLFLFFADRGLLARHLPTGAERWLVDKAFHTEPKGRGTGSLIFGYTDRESGKIQLRCLNLSTATMETLPIGDDVSGGTRQGETWLLHSNETEGLQILVRGAQAHSLLLPGKDVRLLSPRQHLLVTDPSGRELTLYQTDGTFLSRCALFPDSSPVTAPDLVWSGYWGGYFFTDIHNGTCRLMFWDISMATEGESLRLSPVEQIQKVLPVPDASLYERAAELSRRFGVEIRIAGQCTPDYTHYDAALLTDPVFLRPALDLLEQSFGQYPEGFFQQLTYGSMESIRIDLVEGLTLKEGIHSHPASIGAFAQDMGSYYVLVLDGTLLERKTVFHEVSHMIDRRLEWDSLTREDALYSEEAWLALQPEGFRYTMSYAAAPEELPDSLEPGYFINGYSLTFPTEGRAVLLAAAMEYEHQEFEPGSGRRAKLQFYADCIRDCFDTEGWPEVTTWEQVLHEPSGRYVYE